MHTNGPRHRILWLILIASLAFNAGVGATVGVRAYNRYALATPEEEPAGAPQWPRMMKELSLTDEQRVELDAARKELRRRHQHLRQTIRVETDILADLLTVEEPDRNAITAQLDKLAEFRSQMDRDMVEHFLEIRGRLKPAQYEAFDRVIRRTLHRGGHGHRGRGGPREQTPGFGREREGRRHRGDDKPRPPIDEETD